MTQKEAEKYVVEHGHMNRLAVFPLYECFTNKEMFKAIASSKFRKTYCTTGVKIDEGQMFQMTAFSVASMGDFKKLEKEQKKKGLETQLYKVEWVDEAGVHFWV